MKLLIAVALATLVCKASTAQEMSYGEAEYLNSCAVCHGLYG
ncbi:MAG: cytochrome C, partial [Mesorhizobium sp.]